MTARGIGLGAVERMAWVGAGSAFGGLARWGLGFQIGGPYAVFAANAAGAFAIGLYAAATGPGGALDAGPRQRLFVMPGLLAGLTSFSLFSLHADQLLRASVTASVLFVGGSVAAWAAGIAAGDALASRLG